MNLNLGVLDFSFARKPLLIGGKAMEHYGLRKAGNDVDLVIDRQDHERLCRRYPGNIKDLYGDIGVCEFGFEIWNQICTFGYEQLSAGAIEKPDYLVVSLEKLLFLKALAMHIPKCHTDLELIVKLTLEDAYRAAEASSP